MVVLEAIRSSNRSLRSSLPGLTALFVGGTSGIGRSTLIRMAHETERPHAFIIGRSKSKAAPFLSELKGINPSGTFDFIEADVSLISSVDKACAELRKKSKTLDMLFMTPGGISLSGRKETSEGLDQLFALRYYSRMRFIQKLMPLLNESTLARVVSVLGGGFEGPICKDDLDLKQNYSVLNCALHSVTMTSLSMEHLVATNATNLSFVHIFPGIVGTNIYTNSFPAPMAAFYNYGVWPMMAPFSVDLEESGERNLFHTTSARYSRTQEGANGYGGVALCHGVELAKGSVGKAGSGVYLTNWKGETSVAGKTMQSLRDEGMAAKIWHHTEKLLEDAARTS